jgi:hypothetical protein
VEDCRLDTYVIWCDLKDSRRDLDFCEAVDDYLAHLKSVGLLVGYRIQRRKLGFGPPELGEFQISIDVQDLRQLQDLFDDVASRGGETEKRHARVFMAVTNTRFALYRDFPDAVRVRPSNDG